MPVVLFATYNNYSTIFYFFFTYSFYLYIFALFVSHRVRLCLQIYHKFKSTKVSRMYTIYVKYVKYCKVGYSALSLIGEANYYTASVALIL